MTDLSLPAVFYRALISVAKAANLPTIQDDTQELIQSSLSDLRLVDSRVSSLSLFSPNEVLADIATRDLVYLLVPYVLADTEGRVKTTDIQERLERVERVERYLRTFLSSLETYQIVPGAEKTLYDKSATAVVDPAKRRELKIQQYRKEKELNAKIQAVQKRRHNTASSGPSSDFELIASLLPDPSLAPNATTAEEEDDLDSEDALREATLLLLRLKSAQVHSQLQSISQELELLRSAPPPRPQNLSQESQHGKDREDNNMWRLDARTPQGGPDGNGPLLDPSGKPLRPFTILPSSSSDRVRLQAQVFQPDHRLPTMSIDQYLEIERQRGNILSGGGPQSEAEPTSSEQLALDAEMDGTAFGEQKAEEKRQKDENWARYTDTHPRGAGNTMNRG
ncbi:serine/threonine protein phosphatase PP2A-associated protein [Amylocystis lapponica]|nr:serine/threonine protein phosphatase PP2A-associated protein [Amylocystis lapponica]